MLWHNFFRRKLCCGTQEGNCVLQKEIVLWLTEVGEARAATWFNDNWTDERGNYTVATAGYVGNHLSSGIESNWRYMRLDVIGCAGSSQRISLPVFTPSLMQYLSIRSKKHADKILCPITGAHKFPSEATYITSKLWKKIQEFKVHRLLLSYCEASQHVRKLWAEDMEFFHSCGKDESFGEAIARFRAAGLRMNLARSATVGFLIPTGSMMRDVENLHFETFAEEEKCVEDCRVMYECMYHREGDLDAEYGETSMEDKLDIMESFVRVTPMPIKSGEMVFLCSSCDCNGRSLKETLRVTMEFLVIFHLVKVLPERFFIPCNSCPRNSDISASKIRDKLQLAEPETCPSTGFAQKQSKLRM